LGSQEKERRAGTENVAGIIGLATAMKLAWDEAPAPQRACINVRDRLLRSRTVRTRHWPRMTGAWRTTSLLFRNVEGSVLLALDMADIAASSGSACTTGALEPSHVLTAMGIDSASRTRRPLTVGKDTSAPQIDRVLETLPAIVEGFDHWPGIVDPYRHRPVAPGCYTASTSS
jgi:cysteine desulfurase